MFHYQALPPTVITAMKSVSTHPVRRGLYHEDESEETQILLEHQVSETEEDWAYSAFNEKEEEIHERKKWWKRPSPYW